MVAASASCGSTPSEATASARFAAAAGRTQQHHQQMSGCTAGRRR